MLRALLVAVAVSLSIAASPADAQKSDKNAKALMASPEIARAKAAVKTLAEKLREELTTAMQAGGPVGAVEKCRTAAPGISMAASSPADGLIVGRTALKVRNPQNRPDAFELKVLEDFAAKAAAGADLATLEHAEEVSMNGVSLVRYMKAIPMAETPCLACHGAAEKVDAAAAAQIKAYYPADQATGFRPGDLRGAFSVTIRK